MCPFWSNSPWQCRWEAVRSQAAKALEMRLDSLTCLGERGWVMGDQENEGEHQENVYPLVN